MAVTEKKPIMETQDDEFSDNQDFASAKNVSLTRKKHQQIVQGACGVFFKKGYHPTSIREIGQACGMSMGQLYHYISCKDDVLFLVHKHMQQVWYEYLKKSDLEQIEDPVKKLKQALYHSLQFMVENRKLIQFVYSESKYLDKKYLKIVLEMDNKNVLGFWRSLLEDLSAVTTIKGDIDIVSSIVVYLQAFLALRGWTLKGKERKDQEDCLINFILRGLGVISNAEETNN
jgi:AcrR family transcriptional regulator